MYFRYRDGTFDGNGDNALDQFNGNYSDNRFGYIVRVTVFAECIGRFGEYMGGMFANEPPTTNNYNPSQETFIPLHSYAIDRGLATDPPFEKKGVYNGYTTSLGERLYLRIFDDPTIDWNNDGMIRGDGDYTPYSDDSAASGAGYGLSLIHI